MRKRMAVIGAGLSCLLAATVGYAQVDATKIADEIRAEAALPSQGPEGCPLPLMSQCNVGIHPLSAGWAPARQMELIEAGHYVMPAFAFPTYDKNPAVPEYWPDAPAYLKNYYEPAMKKAHELRLPIVLVGTQWEQEMYQAKSPYLSLPPDQNPNVVEADGKVEQRLSPFGPVGPWEEVGRKWTDSPLMKQLQEWYPDPPLVIFTSNNEAQKLVWTHVDQDRRYVQQYGKGKSDDFKRQVVGDGWIERYRAMQKGMRDGLSNPEWKKNVIFIAYEAGGVPCLGRWGGWMEYSLHIPGRMDPSPLMWDGGSQSYYLDPWSPTTDFKAWSPQLEFMNLVFQKEDDLKLAPRFWYEFCTWDGYDPAGKTATEDKRKFFASEGHPFSPERYAGMVQFGMWLLRVRAVREYRNWTEPRDETTAPYYQALLASVDRVHTNPILREFWRTGELVPNRARSHMYEARIPAEFQGRDRWFLLDADVNPQEYPWETFWKVQVFALALVKGQAPERQWLVYASSPLEARKNVRLTIPGYKDITVAVAVGGSFYLVDEKSGGVKEVQR